MSKSKNLSLSEFQSKFSDENTCYEYLVKARWSNGFICPSCGHNHVYQLKNGRFQCKYCRKQTSVTAGTILHRTHLPLTTWFLAFYLVTQDKRGISAVQLSAALGVQYDTAWNVLRRIRQAMGDRDQNHLLQGMIEFDDAYIGGPTVGGKRGRGTDKSKFFVALSLNEDGSPKFLKMEVTKNLKKGSVEKFAKSAFAPDSKIISDGCASYTSALKNFHHVSEVFNPESENLRWLHIMIANLKSFVLGTYHGLPKKYLQSYLDEFCFRFSRRHFHDKLLDRLAIAMATSTLADSNG